MLAPCSRRSRASSSSDRNSNLVMPMPCSPRDDAAQASRQLHDARDGLVRRLQHRVVVAVDGDVGVHVAVAGVHVQGHPHAAACSTSLVDALALSSSDAARRPPPPKSCCSGCWICFFQLKRATPVVLQPVEVAAFVLAWPIQLSPASEPSGRRPRSSRLPAPAARGHPAARRSEAMSHRVVALAQGQAALSRRRPASRVDQLQLVAQAQLDVDALDAQRVLAHALERDDHVLVDLERVGVLGRWPPCACGPARTSCAPRG